MEGNWFSTQSTFWGVVITVLKVTAHFSWQIWCIIIYIQLKMQWTPKCWCFSTENEVIVYELKSQPQKWSNNLWIITTQFITYDSVISHFRLNQKCISGYDCMNSNFTIRKYDCEDVIFTKQSHKTTSFPPPISCKWLKLQTVKVDLFDYELRFRLFWSMKLKEKHTKKATIHRVCTFLMCECDTEELGPTYERDFYFYYQIRSL